MIGEATLWTLHPGLKGPASSLQVLRCDTSQHFALIFAGRSLALRLIELFVDLGDEISSLTMHCHRSDHKLRKSAAEPLERQQCSQPPALQCWQPSDLFRNMHMSREHPRIRSLISLSQREAGTRCTLHRQTGPDSLSRRVDTRNKKAVVSDELQVAKGFQVRIFHERKARAQAAFDYLLHH